MTLKHSTVAPGVDSGDGKLSKNAWDEDHVINNGLEFPAETPTQPEGDKLKMYGKKLAGRMMSAFKSSNEVDQLLQTYIGDGQISMWSGNNGSSSFTNYGAIAGSTQGTPNNANIALTSKVQSITAVEVLQVSLTTSNIASWRFTAPQWVRGNNVGGGFFFHMRNAPATGCSNTAMRFFMGMRQSLSLPADAEPSSYTNIIGFGWDSADEKCQIFTNDGSGAATKTDMGASWPVPVTDRSVMYDVFIFAPPNTSSIFVTVINIANGATYSGEFSTDIPAQTTYLGPLTYTSVGGVSAVSGIRFASCFLQAFS